MHFKVDSFDLDLGFGMFYQENTHVVKYASLCIMHMGIWEIIKERLVNYNYNIIIIDSMIF